MATETGPTGEAGSSVVNIKTFLAEHKLLEMEKKFLTLEIDLEELLEFNTEELTEFADEMGLDTLQKKRFIKGIESLQNKDNAPSNPISHPSMDPISTNTDSGSSVVRVVISSEEQKSIQKLSERYLDVSARVTTVESNYATLAVSTKQINTEIDTLFQSLNKQLMDRKQSLLAQLSLFESDKKILMDTHLQQLTDYRSEIKQIEQRSRSMMADPTISVNKRKVKIGSMVDTIVESKRRDDLMATEIPPKMELKFDESKWDSFLNYHLSIDKCDRPIAVSVKIRSVSNCGAELEWDVPCRGKRTPSEFRVEYCRIIPDSQRNRYESSTYRREKKKSKRNQRSDDSSSDSKSESDSDSDGSESDDNYRNTDMRSLIDTNEDETKDNNGLKWIECNKSASVNVDKLLRDGGSDGILNMSYRMRNLRAASKYMIRVRGRNRLGWGDYCEPVTITTNALTLTWNLQRLAKVDKQKTSRSQIRIRGEGKTTADFVIRSEWHPMFAWEVTLVSVSNPSFIGFFKAPIRYKVNWSAALGKAEYEMGSVTANEFSIAVRKDRNSVTVYNANGNGGKKSLALPGDECVSKGDRFALRLDSNAKICELWYNGKYLGVAFKRIPLAITPAISNSSKKGEYLIRYQSYL